MTSISSPPPNDDNDHIPHQQQHRITPPQTRRSDVPGNFVLGRPHTGQSRSNTNQRFTNGAGGSYTQTTDAEHSLALLEHLSTDLGNLLNRTDISDCFLNVKGTKNLLFKKYLSLL